MKTRMMAAVIAVLMGSPALAASVERRTDLQQARIAEGVRSGELTRHEAARLERKEGRLNREIGRDRADGPRLTGREHAKLERQENRLSRQIYRQKHDCQRR